MLKRFQSFFEGTVYKVENNSTPFPRYLLLFAAILVLRLALEFLSSRRLFNADDIMHIGLWFLFIVLAFLIQMKLYSGEQMIKVARLVIVFFSIALTAPILDLIITGGVGAKMNYLSINSWKEFWWSYITIGGSSFSRGATLGIRFEIILLLIASFNYVRTKRKSWRRALLAVFSMYNVLFLSGAIPLLLNVLVQFFDLQYQHNDQSTLLLLLSLDIVLLGIALRCHRPALVFKILKSAPWGGILLSLIFFILGVCLALSHYPGNLKWSTTTIFWIPMLLIIFVCFAAWTGIVRMQNREGSGTEYYAASNVLLLIILFVGAMMSDKIFFTITLFWGILFLLYQPPLLLVKVPGLRQLLEAMALLSVSFAGFCTGNAPMIGFPHQWLWLILGGTFIAGFITTFSAKKPEG